MLGTLLDLLAGVVILTSLFFFGWLGLAGSISPRLVGGRSRFGLLWDGILGFAVSLYLMTAIMEPEPDPEPEPAAASAPAPAPAPGPDPPPPDPPDTSWIVEANVAAAVGDQELLRIGVSCRGDNWIVAVGVVDEGGDLARAHWSWDGERSVDYNLLERYVALQSTLTTSRDVIRAARIVENLRSRTVLGLSVDTTNGYRSSRVGDIFGLAGASAAFDSLTCPELAPPRQFSFSMDTEAGIVATLVQSSVGSSVETVLSLMAGYEPTPSRTGERRLFTYRFDDGSVLVLTFVPPGGRGTGLVLDDIAVR